MMNSRKLKQSLMSGTFLVLCTAMTAGCGLGQGHTLGDLAGETRTLPDDDIVDFGNRHSPILNPATNIPYNPDADSEAGMHNGPRSDAMPPAAPSRNYASAMPSAAPLMVAPGRHVPVENQNILTGSGSAPAMMSAPVSPVIAEAVPPAPAPIATPVETAPAIAEAVPAPVPAPAPVTAEAAPVPAAPAEAAPTLTPPAEMKKSSVAKASSEDDVPSPVASGDIDLSGSKPSLASVPAVPSVPPADQTAAQFNSLAAEQGKSEADRQQLMNNSGATVMTSPETGKVVDNAATAAAPADTASAATPAKSEGGFGGWLNNLFSKKESTPATAPAADAAPAAPAAADSSVAVTPPADTAMTPATASAGTEVAPNVVLGKAPAFPPAETPAAPDAQKSMSDTLGQPVALTPQASGSDAVPLPVGTSLPQPPEGSVAVTPSDTAPAPVASAPTATPPFAVDTAAAPPPAATSDAAAVTPQAAMDASMQSVHLTPPSAPQTVSTLPDVSQVSGTPEAPMNLVPPSQNATSPTKYLPDARYSSRRGESDDSSGN